MLLIVTASKELAARGGGLGPTAPDLTTPRRNLGMAMTHVIAERDTVQAASQIEKLEAVIAAAQSARHAAARNLLLASRAGVALLDAIHDLTEVDGVFDFAADVRREVCMDCDDWPTLPALRPITVQPVKLNPAIWEGGETC